MNTVTQYPAFPLPLVVFPGHVQGIHVSEPRYRKLLLELKKGESNRFIIPFQTSKRWEEYASEVKLKEILLEHRNGNSDILVEGVNTVRITQAFPSGNEHEYHRVTMVRKKFRDLTCDRFFIEKLQSILQPVQTPENTGFGTFSGNIFDLAARLEINEPEKSRFISLPNNAMRKQFLLNLARIRVSLAAQMTGNDNGIIMN